MGQLFSTSIDFTAEDFQKAHDELVKAVKEMDQYHNELMKVASLYYMASGQTISSFIFPKPPCPLKERRPNAAPKS